jgi:hypothetical protein
MSCQHWVRADRFDGRCKAFLCRGEPANGTSRTNILDRLDRDGGTELAAQVRAGEMSAKAAAIEAAREHPAILARVAPCVIAVPKENSASLRTDGQTAP